MEVLILKEKKADVAVIGNTGRLGVPLVKLLNNHPYVRIIYTENTTEKRGRDLSDAELVFLALPHGKSKDFLPEINSDQRVIDLSQDHRGHPEWVYGLSEIYREKIRSAKKVANSGCYAISVILGVLPLKGRIKRLRIFSTSGISGAGKKLSREDNIESYLTGIDHYQLGEMKKILGVRDILFSPKRIHNMDRGILSEILVEMDDCTGNALKSYWETYRKNPFVRIVDPRIDVETRRVLRSNYCDIKISQFASGAIIISALDNLMKGGAGQAVQNFNLMCGFPETTGLM